MAGWRRLVLGLIVLQTIACNQAYPAAPGTDAGDGRRPAESVQPRAPKTLTVAVLGEPTTFGEIGVAVATAGGDRHIRHIAHDYLMVEDERNEWQPQLAVEAISPDRGTWTVNADGTMDTTWRIRPNVLWHDGPPFTADDLLFGFTVYKDPSVPLRVRAGLDLMESARVLDPLTFEVRWSRPYFAANEAPGLFPLPRHLLEDLYRTDREGFINSTYLKSDFVGLGPYRLTRWEPGSHMEFVRFDGYYRGKRPLDAVVMRWLGDPNTMIANIMAGAADAVLPVGVRLEEALELKGRWQGTGNQVVADLSGRLRHLEIQHRQEYASPINGMTNRSVRRAFYHAIDRRAVVDLMNPGLDSPPADSWFPPNHALRPQVEAAIPRFPYDPTQAQELLTQAGWMRGAGGTLLSEKTGDPFVIRIWNTQSTAADREMNVVADYWKTIGAQVDLYLIPTASASDREARAKLPGVGLTGVPFGDYWVDRLHTRNVTAESNRWVGSNRGGYSNPRVDALLDRMVVTIAPNERLALHRDLLQEQMGDVALMPLYWDLDPTLMLKGVRGVATPSGAVNLANVLQWDKD